MHVIGIHRVNKGIGHKVLGLAYVKCILDQECKATKDQSLYKFGEDFGVKINELLSVTIIY